ncbi:phenylalanine--tRNA ligase subunit alpha [Rickettsiales bacterium LUAb2]
MEQLCSLLEIVKIKLALENISTYNLTLNDIENLRVKILGKSGIITESLKGFAKLSIEEKKIIGPKLNSIKTELTSIIETVKQELNIIEINDKLKKEGIDVTLPVYQEKSGKLHPISSVLEQVVNIFAHFGFMVKEGPEIENEWYNFSALNFTDLHPAKDDHDTFYFNNKQQGKKLLRTHTSTVQIRTLQEAEYLKNTNQDDKSPKQLRMIAPGRVFRSDDDATHTPVFHQLEGLYIAPKVSVAELKGMLTAFCSYFFGIDNVPLRFRPSYFPFTTPSFEVDIACKFNKNKIEIGKGSDWLEILGSGIVHPNVLQNCGIDSKKYQGFAFGVGLERMAMLKYGFPDLRAFFSNDYRWLQNSGFSILKSPNFAGGLD